MFTYTVSDQIQYKAVLYTEDWVGYSNFCKISFSAYFLNSVYKGSQRNHGPRRVEITKIFKKNNFLFENIFKEYDLEIIDTGVWF